MMVLLIVIVTGKNVTAASCGDEIPVKTAIRLTLDRC